MPVSCSRWPRPLTTIASVSCRTPVATGALPVAKAAQICRFHIDVSGIADATALAAMTRELVRGASGVDGLTGRQLAIAINHAGRLLKPERDLVNEDRVRRAHRALYKSAGPAGMTTYRLVLDPEGAAILDAAIDPLASPHTRTCDDPMCGCRPGDADSAGRCRCNLAEAGTGCSCQRTSSEDRSDDGSRSGCDGGAAEGGRAGRSREADLRTPAARQADALLMVVARGVSSPGKAPKTAKSQVVVTMSFDSLREGIRGAGLTVGEELLSATTLPRLACDADIVPAVLGTRADVLEVGRKKRLLTSAIRVAAWLRDRHCTYRGCTIPCQWCDGHHGVAWYAGGDTGLLNTATLCARHHTIVHERDVRCTITDTRVTWHV